MKYRKMQRYVHIDKPYTKQIIFCNMSNVTHMSKNITHRKGKTIGTVMELMQITINK